METQSKAVQSTVHQTTDVDTPSNEEVEELIKSRGHRGISTHLQALVFGKDACSIATLNVNGMRADNRRALTSIAYRLAECGCSVCVLSEIRPFSSDHDTTEIKLGGCYEELGLSYRFFFPMPHDQWATTDGFSNKPAYGKACKERGGNACCTAVQQQKVQDKGGGV